ncbi:MAG TPA: SCO family protein [Steroidobacteraceae bacterium]|nr:SCO family protein [Steroidobacteraceae bacterium]
MKWMGTLLLMVMALQANAYIDKSKVGWDQHVGTQLPLDLSFTNSEGQSVPLGTIFNDKPVVLAFVYFSCPELCPEVLAGIQQALRNAGLVVGENYDLIGISIDPRDTATNAATRLRHFPPEVRAHAQLLTTDDDHAARLARAAGFRYVYDAEHQQFAHPAGFLIATPNGKISRYFFGVRYDPAALRSAIASAQQGSVSSVVRQLLLVCFHFDPTQGPYSAAIMGGLRIVSIALLAVVGLWAALRAHSRGRV